ncbi:arginine--tRNA ligase, chloroplastic/mitochondrial, partial [Tanacetum coccineum]
EPKRWSLQEEILKPLETALEHIQSYIKLCALKHKDDPGDGDSYPDLKQEHTDILLLKGIMLKCLLGMDQNVKLPWNTIRRKKKRTSICWEGITSINELGVVTIELSGKWIAKCIHKMLKDWNGLCEQAADWIIYLTPVRQQAYIEMCFAAAKLEGWMIPSDRHKPPRTSYAGYQACTTVLDDNLLDKAKTRCVVVEQGLNLISRIEFEVQSKHRLAVCTFDKSVNEEGNTFVYLLNTQAEIRRITDDYHKDISELKKASELILENDEGWEEGVERILGSHLLEFTEALEESCSSVLPHILCKYLYDLAKKFNRYHSCVCK